MNQHRRPVYQKERTQAVEPPPEQTLSSRFSASLGSGLKFALAPVHSWLTAKRPDDPRSEEGREAARLAAGAASGSAAPTVHAVGDGS